MRAHNLDDAIMADVTYYVALPFGAGDDGPEPREAVECTSASAAIMRAERLARTEGHIGAVASVGQAIRVAVSLGTLLS
jgi:hypothetical protein